MDNGQTQPVPVTNDIGTICSGLSGNEMYCASLLGLRPGNLLIGNSVFSMGIMGGLRSSVKTTIGGEVHAYTDMIQQGRGMAFGRLKSEMQQHQGCGVTGVSNELVFHGNNIEFLSVGSAVHSANPAGSFTTSADAQELFCQVDAGYQPISFVFGNVAYSIGVAGHIMANIRQLARGEVRAYSDLFNTTRNLALQRIVKEAQSVNANAVIGIETTILPFGTSGVQEMVMIGTAWNIAKLGYMPMQLVLGTSVYSLGVVGGLKSAIKEMVHGEVNALTQMIYGARENSIAKLQQQATAVSADDVLGIKTYVYQLGGDLIEFLAIGTAVKRVNGLSTRSPQLPPQAIIRDKDTFINTAELHFGVDLNTETTDHQ